MYRCFEHKSSSSLILRGDCVCVSVWECRSLSLAHTDTVRLSLFWTLTDVRPIGFSQYSTYWSQQWSISLSLSVSVALPVRVCMCIAYSIVIKCVRACVCVNVVSMYSIRHKSYSTLNINSSFRLFLDIRTPHAIYQRIYCDAIINYDRVNTAAKQSKAEICVLSSANYVSF